ncbi:ABC transporter substrate-binding protein [Salinispira pacifica]|nr:ABC transporter substrate-binding protein [Salinispira pacifica]
MKRALPVFFLLLLPLALFAGGQSEPSTATEPVVIEEAYQVDIVDSYGRSISFSEAPQRIISVAPSITEFVYALGAGDRLIGRTDFCNYPAAVNDIESIGSLREPNLERIVELNPDVVLVSTHFTEDNLNTLEELGIVVVSLYNEESFEGVYELARIMGELLDTEDAAEALVDEMRETVAMVTERIATVNERPKVYYVVGFGQWGDYTAGGDTFIGEMIVMAGGDNIASDVEGWSYSFEKIVENDPEIIICSEFYDTPASLQAAEGYGDLNAIKNGNLRPLNNNLIDRQGPRLADGLLALATTIHPDLF